MDTNNHDDKHAIQPQAARVGSPQRTTEEFASSRSPFPDRPRNYQAYAQMEPMAVSEREMNNLVPDIAIDGTEDTSTLLAANRSEQSEPVRILSSSPSFHAYALLEPRLSSDAVSAITNSEEETAKPAPDCLSEQEESHGSSQLSQAPSADALKEGTVSHKDSGSLSSDSDEHLTRKDDSSIPNIVEVDSVEESCADRRTRRRRSMLSGPPRKYFAYALILWVTELLIVLGLKKYGILGENFTLEEVVIDRILPHFNESMPLSYRYLTQEKQRPGFKLAQQGATAKYPVVIVPGFVTSGLEVWGGKECARKFFRQRLWAALSGARSLLMERDCWIEHMMLDPWTGSDPGNIRLRAAEGFVAADYFLGTYWVWGKIIENLADVGYSPSMMAMEAYDWRVAFPVLEERDGYLTRLRQKIETLHRLSGEKVVITSHSMGALLVHHFFAWVTTSEKDGGGGGGKNWVDEHIHGYVNIAGAHLGVPKAVTALLSGEMSDTAMLGRVAGLVEQFLGRRMRRNLFSTWGSIWAMLPQGGDEVWGAGVDLCGDERSDDDPLCPTTGLSPLIAMTDSHEEKEEGVRRIESDFVNNRALNKFLSRHSHSIKEALGFLKKYGGGYGPDMANAKLFSLDHKERRTPKAWHDATRTPLPYAPNMRIYCMYGTGLDTERAYYYKHNLPDVGEGVQGVAPTNMTDPPVVLDASVEDESRNVKYGVRFINGDGSVPLLSLGYVCADAWQRKDSGLNPSGTKVFTREYEHKDEFVIDDPMRSGPSSADHVDILGNLDMTEDLLRVVTDFERSNVSANRITSNIEEMAKKINSRRNGGLKRRKRWW